MPVNNFYKFKTITKVHFLFFCRSGLCSNVEIELTPEIRHLFLVCQIRCAQHSNPASVHNSIFSIYCLIFLNFATKA